jgi:uncharacterized protein DUF3435
MNSKVHGHRFSNLDYSNSNTFQLPEIIYDPSLILSPHVFLLGMLFYIQAFKSPSIASPEKLYDLRVLNGLNEQKLPLRDDLADKFVFCEAVREGEAVKLLHELRLSDSKVRYRMRKGGEITGFEQTAKPYVLRNGAANQLNANRKLDPLFPVSLYSPQLLTTAPIADVSDSLQNLIMMHSNIDTYLKHYSNHNIGFNTYRNYRGLDPKADDYLMLNSMSRSIDPRRPWKLTAEASRSVNDQPRIQRLLRKVDRLKQRCDSTVSREEREIWEDRYKDALKELNNGCVCELYLYSRGYGEWSTPNAPNLK